MDFARNIDKLNLANLEGEVMDKIIDIDRLTHKFLTTHAKNCDPEKTWWNIAALIPLGLVLMQILSIYGLINWIRISELSTVGVFCGKNC